MKNTIFKNLLKAIGIMGYFIVLNFAYTRMNVDRLMNDIEVFSGIFLVLGLVFLERAYKKDSGKIAISGIELLCLSMHSLSINHVITFYQYDFRTYLVTSSYIFAIYYVLKSIVIYTKEKREYLKRLSDISEIVKEEPIKKEAKKRRKVRNIKENQEKQEEKLEEINNKEEKTKKEKNNKKELEEKNVKEEKEEKQTKKDTKRKTTTKKQQKGKKVNREEDKNKVEKNEKQEDNKEKKEVKKEKNKKKRRTRKKEVVDND